MNLSTRRHPLTALLMSLVMLITSLPLGSAHAGMVSTNTIIEQQTLDATVADETSSARERIRDLLARDDIRAEMIALGITPVEAAARIDALTDEEVADIAGRLDELPAGGMVGTILLALFIVFGVAVLVDALGILNIFPFVCPPGQCGVQQQVQSNVVEPAGGPIQTEPLAPQEPRSAFRRDQFDRFDGRNQGNVESNQFFEPQAQPEAPNRNYFEERFGTQRYVR